MTSRNYVGELKEFADKQGWVLRFEEVGCPGTTFTLKAVLKDKEYPEGVGRNKKEAKQKAAENALISLKGEHMNTTEIVSEASTSAVLPVVHNNYMCWLNEYCMKESLTYKPVEIPKSGPNLTTQWCYFVVDGKEYLGAYGKTKKEAKEEAAKQVYNEICGSKTTESGDGNISGTVDQPKQDLNQPVPDTGGRRKSLTATNFIGLIDDYCKKAGCFHVFTEDRRCGQAHAPKFYYKLKIKDKEYPVGEGKSIKEAKQHAAQLAWAALEDSKGTSMSALCDDVAALKLATPARTQDSGCAKSSLPATPSGSAAFTNSSKPPKEQDQSPIVKPKIKLAANFQNVAKASKEDIMPNFKRDNDENIDREKSSTNSGASRFISEFDSIEHLGHGAFGNVFKAKQKLLDKYYAIKIVRCKEEALREVGALSDLQHPNIVRYYTCWLEDCDYQWESSSGSFSSSQSSSEYSGKYLYIKMELCDARTLRVWIDEKNTQNVKKSLRDSRRRNDSLTFALQIVSGVEYIHSKMLFHRDLKPANIMLGQDGKMKIGDFGLVAESYDSDNLVERSMSRGTPSYMAPEQKEKKTYDRKVDIFALGLIYFEMLWNISGHERVLIWGDVRNQNLPKEFCQHFGQETLVIKSLLRVNPEERPEASQLKADLEKFIQASEAREQRTC
ncbi:interferon-induced, double-stranded RNA-activated protein kinase-like [Salarias fasciatus]|uniref:Interferon-induced, double-stranded RNA-activated protein kinase-like n=1 Tax=Salarias fasciatus TaxID=181472 RepID=A0A672J937_SALFA|nr:interferon-induced, double-stranded RNA-activated protein kinase-like [Salarias fasciatus]